MLINREIFSKDKLLKVVEQLSQPELDQFVSQVIALQAERRAPSMPQREAELLQKIDQWIPAEVHKRYDKLTAKRQAGMLTPDEYKELLRLADQSEHLETQCLKNLVELANLRGTSLRDLMTDLGIGTSHFELIDPDYGLELKPEIEASLRESMKEKARGEGIPLEAVKKRLGLE